MPWRCAAVPEALAAIGRSSPDRVARLRAAASRLDHAAFLVGAHDIASAGALHALAAAIADHAAAGAALDSWVGTIADAFARADPSVATLGDLAHAEHVAVIVPGMGASLDADSEVRRRAQRLYDAARALDPDTAVVAWLGYRPPGPRRALLDDDAETGGTALARFVAALPRSPQSDITIVAHSYGTLVTADALRDGMRVDDVVLLGSPGVEAQSATELPAPRGEVYAERAPLDLVGLSETFGPDPADSRFGAIRLATGKGVTGHSAYFDSGSLALANIAAVVTQRDELLVRDDPSPVEEMTGHVDDVWQAVVEAPVDTAQRTVADINGVLDHLGDLPGAAASPGLSFVDQAARAEIVEEAGRLVDLAQHLASPDGAADLARDAWSFISGADE